MKHTCILFLIFQFITCFANNEDLLARAKSAMHDNRHNEALSLFDQMLNIAPNWQAHFYSGIVYIYEHEYKKAIDHFDYLIEHNFIDRAIFHNKAHSLKQCGNYEQALESYQKALDLDPAYQMSHFGIGECFLACGNFEQGWEHYQWNLSNWQELKKMLDGCTNFSGKKVALIAQNASGDSIQFIRYAQLLKKAGATIIMQSIKPLMTLFSSCCPYLDLVVEKGQKLPQKIDILIPLMSLPYIFHTAIDTIPSEVPYIFPNEQLVTQWKEKLNTDNKKFNIGLCWQCSNNVTEQNPLSRRAVPLQEFIPLFSVPDTRFFSLQRFVGTEQLNSIDTNTIFVFDDSFDIEHGRFMDTAAVIKNLDLVITVDTSIAHLAGALGIPVWVLIPSVAEWRWMQYRTDSPWYPTMHLFRQKKYNEWQPVIQEIHKELQKIVLKNRKTL